MKIGIAQMNSIVGDLSFNADEIISRYQDLVSSGRFGDHSRTFSYWLSTKRFNFQVKIY